MKRRNLIRIVFITALLGSSLYLGLAYANSDVRETTSEVPRAYEQGSHEQVVPPRENITFLVSDRRFKGQVKSAIIAFAPNGSVMYYNDSFSNYQDSDPSPRGKYTFFVVGADWIPDSECESERSCTRMVFQHVNISTGETNTFYSQITTSDGSRDWHDVDRINDTHYVVADIARDRVFIVNTTSELVTWEWDVKSEYSLSSGGEHPGDWSHMNDVEYLGDGIEPDLMVNLRNQDQVVFLDFKKGLLENWTLGADDAHEIIFEPHNPDYIPKSNGGPAILIADSENNRIVEYQRDSTGWNLSWVWRDDQMQWPRDADRLPNGHTLITDSNRGRVFEVNKRGEIVWQFDWSMPYEAERLGTGSESTNGPSAVRANLSSVYSGGVLPADQNKTGLQVTGVEKDQNTGLLWRIKNGVKSVVPPTVWATVTSGILFIVPGWMGFSEIFVSVGLLFLLMVWVVLEGYWSPYSVMISKPIRITKQK